MKTILFRILRKILKPVVLDIVMKDARVFVDDSRIFIAKTAAISNALLNTNSGTITIGEYSFCGQNTLIITGTHNYNLFGKDRMWSIPQSGQDIIIGNGVWIGSNACILGPCVIGDNAVIAAGSVVKGIVEKNTIVAGVPARVVKIINSDDLKK